MLDQLVESRSHGKENTKKNVLLLTTMAIVFTAGVSALGYSLFNENLFVGGDGLELSTLVAPPIPEEAPPPPEEKKPEEEKVVKKVNADVRKELIANLDMTPPKTPPKISTDKMTQKTVRTNVAAIKGDRNDDSYNFNKDKSDVKDLKDSGFKETGGNQDGGETGGDTPKATPKPTPPPLSTPTPRPTPPPVPKRISGGVVNGSAISLPQPSYPPAARAANIKGSVNVAVIISKSGSVMSASATSGHPLLKNAAVSAARRARFKPTLLSGQAVEVSGVIVYNFR